MGFIIFYLLFSFVAGFVVALILQKVFRKVLRFRSQWIDTLKASMMTCLVFGLTFPVSFISFNRASDYFILQLVATTAVISLITAFLSFQFIVKSESGRSLHPMASLSIAFILVLPPTLIGTIVGVAV